MPLYPGSSAFNNALDNHITGNQGLDYGKDWEPMEDEFYDLAEKTQTSRLHEAVRDLLLGRIEWEDMVEYANLDEQEAQLFRLQFIQPTNDKGREAFIDFFNAAKQVVKVFERIPFDDRKTSELAKKLEGNFRDRKDRGY